MGMDTPDTTDMDTDTDTVWDIDHTMDMADTMVWDTVDTTGARQRMSVTIPSQFVQTCQFFILPLSFRTKLSTTALKNTEIPDYFFFLKRDRAKYSSPVMISNYPILILLETVKPK